MTSHAITSEVVNILFKSLCTDRVRDIILINHDVKRALSLHHVWLFQKEFTSLTMFADDLVHLSDTHDIKRYYKSIRVLIARGLSHSDQYKKTNLTVISFDLK